MKYLALGTAVVAIGITPAVADDHAMDYAVAAAQLALPAALEDSVTVISVDAEGTETLVRQGSSDISCRVSKGDDDGAANRLSVWCVPSAMRAMYVRGREIRETGVSREEGIAQLRAEMESGELDVSSLPQVGYAYRGAADTYGKDVASIEGTSWQIVAVPFATGETLGVIEEPEGSMPWVMASGTPWAHIMVSGASDEEFD